MQVLVPIRRRAPKAVRTATLWLAAALVVPVAWGSSSHLQYQQPPAPIERRAPQPRPEAANQAERKGPPRGEHLAEWMNQHRALTLQQQEQALTREPGFRELPSQTQQRMLGRLAQLNAMNPQQRQRLLARNEAMERLSPSQRAEVRGAMGELGSLPLEQRREVARTFRALRDLPPEQRISAYASGRYGSPLTDPQREVLFNLLKVEPMLPPPESTPASQPGR